MNTLSLSVLIGAALLLGLEKFPSTCQLDWVIGRRWLDEDPVFSYEVPGVITAVARTSRGNGIGAHVCAERFHMMLVWNRHPTEEHYRTYEGLPYYQSHSPSFWHWAGAYFNYERWSMGEEAGKAVYFSVHLTRIIALAAIVPLYASAKRLRGRWRGRAGGFAVVLKKP